MAARTIQGIVDRALEKAGIKDPGQAAEAEDQASAIEELNDMMLEWHQAGVWANYSMASAVTDANTAYGWIIGAMKSFLCMRLCAEYQRPVPTGIAAVANQQWKMILANMDENAETSFPETMPIGSGNSLGYSGRFSGDPYFSGSSVGYLTVAGGTITNGKGQPVQDGPTDILDADRNQ
jgi:hypothetical protein